MIILISFFILLFSFSMRILAAVLHQFILPNSNKLTETERQRDFFSRNIGCCHTWKQVYIENQNFSMRINFISLWFFTYFVCLCVCMLSVEKGEFQIIEKHWTVQRLSNRDRCEIDNYLIASSSHELFSALFLFIVIWLYLFFIYFFIFFF